MGMSVLIYAEYKCIACTKLYQIVQACLRAYGISKCPQYNKGRFHNLSAWGKGGQVQII